MFSSLQNGTIRKFKIKGMPKDKEFNALPFGRQIEGLRTIQQFKAENKSIHLSQKRKSYTKAIREAIDLYNVEEYFCQFLSGSEAKDDSFEFWFKPKAPTLTVS